MHQMVGDLLEFARVSFGQTIPIEPVPMDIEAVVRDVVAEVRASSPGREIRAEFVGDLRGKWDRERLFQALTNLVGNAVQHGSAGAPVQLTARGAADTVTIAVHNDGPTIGREQMARLFQGMNGVPRRDGRDRRHLGLGLYIVDKIVTAHAGRIEVQSSAEQGTTFTLHLPRCARRSDESAEALGHARTEGTPKSDVGSRVDFASGRST
jgi:signal transduction histidine kinase